MKRLAGSPGFLRRLRQRAWHAAGVAFIASIFLLAGGSVATYVTVHHTAQPEFCNSCHIMEPYYLSWQQSTHKDVSCIECHYEPGALETLEGKFKALSQLAKYVTRTAGTKPWAEVSDQSCMRSGCHSVRMLDGPVQFGNIRFDHRQHLLESRRGRRLRCTSCHSQVVQGEHVAVTSSVCITCHFMPGADGEVPEATSDCLVCHGPPAAEVLVAGRAFAHGPYIERGVDCRECHDPVIEGEGTVRKERCHSCHAEIGHVERIGETAFLHEKHVTEHKVECFECHDEIHHGLLPLEKPAPSPKEGCGACHANTHDAAHLLYAGTGAVGLPDEPSRMYSTRVVCEACHTGRSGYATTDGKALAAVPQDPHAFPLQSTAAAHAGAGASGAHASTVASAGNVDCIHCHGTSYDGMLAEWQGAVGEQLERLGPLLGELEASAAPPEPVRQALQDARRNLSLVALDGSRGAHNVGYALDSLRASAERIDLARELLGLEPVAAAAGFPFRSQEGCSECHAAAGRPASIWAGEARFPHRRHLEAELSCGECHSVEQHGQPAFPREQCASCHHQESERFDVGDCARCHPAQASLLAGTVEGFEPLPSPKSEMECVDCHGEAPAIVRPQPQMCVLCHAPGYDQKQLEWQSAIETASARLRQALSESTGASEESLDAARRALDAVAADGSRGVHNFALALKLLQDALGGLER